MSHYWRNDEKKISWKQFCRGYVGEITVAIQTDYAWQEHASCKTERLAEDQGTYLQDGMDKVSFPRLAQPQQISETHCLAFI